MINGKEVAGPEVAHEGPHIHQSRMEFMVLSRVEFMVFPRVQ